ncbi:MAG: hypothetical protein M1465_00865 [Candidatus Marsarchaeota archaeon]|jgi:tRNA (guanine26-N2/guanine27-N2)-dimethyltransferase|nr:hypothetical protein [Candidatus Marsarchaeota archaeon]
MRYTEGSAVIEQGKAFINPKAKFSRDATIAYAMLYPRIENALDATSATGIRGIRYAKELNLKNVTFLEINGSAYPYLESNIKTNKIKRFSAHNMSVQEFCNISQQEKFDMIDIDPFGSPAPYIYDSLKVSHDGTIMAFTATDTAVLCGAHNQACIRTYGAVPMHNELGHEAGTRILIGFVATLAAQFNYGISVGIAFSYLHYMRAIIRLEHGNKRAMDSLRKMGFAYKCGKCGWIGYNIGMFPTKNCCDVCGSKLEISGRMWLGDLIEGDVRPKLGESITSVQGADAKEIKFAERIASEPNTPFYYSIPKLTKLMGLPSVSELSVIEGLLGKNYKASLTHFEKNCVKTDAPLEEIKSLISSLSKGRF